MNDILSTRNKYIYCLDFADSISNPELGRYVAGTLAYGFLDRLEGVFLEN